MSLKNEREVLKGLRCDADKSVELFSGPGQKELEKRVVRGFLKALGVVFLEQEIQVGGAEPIDVCFRNARFQVTEVLDPKSRRNGEWKQVTERRHEANALEQLMEQYTPSRPMQPTEAIGLVQRAVTKKWRKYRSGCGDVDMLVSISLQNRHLCPTSPWAEVSDFRDQGWRSVSLLFVWHTAVLFSSATAPHFIRSAVGQTRQGPYDLFEP